MHLKKHAEKMAEAFMLMRPVLPSNFPEDLAARLREIDEWLNVDFRKTLERDDTKEVDIRLEWFIEVIEQWLRTSQGELEQPHVSG